jgi:hypothetical protein
MAKTKITTFEIQSLIAFGAELDRRMKQARIGFAELSRLTEGTISTGYISDIVRAGRGDSQKYFRLGREKVAILAKALDWNADEALNVAGFKSADNRAEVEPNQRAEEAARAAEMIENWMTLSPERQAQALEFLRFLKAQDPEGLEMLGPKFKVKTPDELDLTEQHVKKVEKEK